MNFARGIVIVSLVIACAHVGHAIAPREPNEKLLALAPQECLAFVHHFGFTESDPNTRNATEQLFAEPTVQRFIEEVTKLADQVVNRAVSEEADPTAAQLAMQGMELLKMLSDRPFSFYIQNVELDDSGSLADVDMGLVVDAGDQVMEIRRRLTQLQGQVPAGIVHQETIAALQCTRIQAEDGPPVYWGTKDNLVIATIGTDSLERLLRDTKTEAPDWLETTRQRLAVPRSWLISYLDGQRLTRMVRQSDPDAERVWSALGFDQVRSIASVVGLDDEGILARSLLSSESNVGLLGIFDARGLTADDLSQVPKNVVNCVGLRLDPNVVLDTVLEITRQVAPGEAAQMEQAIAQTSQALGADIRNEIVAGFGDRWIVYATGQQVAMFAPDVVLAVDVRQAEGVEKALGILMQAVNAEDNPVKIATTTIDGRSGFYLKGAPIAPTWCLTPDKLVVGMQKQSISAFLDGLPDVSSSLASQPRVAQLLNDYEKPFLISFSDSRSSIQASYSVLQMLMNMGAGQLDQTGIDFDPTTLPPLHDIAKHLQPAVASLRRASDGIEFVSRQTMPQYGVGVGTPVAVALLLPAVNAARAAARRNQSLNNMRNIGLAVANYEAVNNRFPAAKFGAGEERGLSWRVAVLPYLEERELYERFHHDEPWDSEHNKTLIAEMPSVYRSPVSNAEPGKTNYLAVRGEDSIIVDAEQGIRIREIRDGVSKTILAVEVNDDRAVTWTKPDDLEWDRNDPVAGLGDMHAGNVFLAVFGDVHTIAVSKSVDPDVLKAMFTRNGGERFDGP